MLAVCLFVVTAVLFAAAAPADDLFLPVDPVADEAARIRLQAAVSPAVETEGPTLRSRRARMDFGLLAGARAALEQGGTAAGLIDLNLFDDAGFRGVDLRTAPTSSGYSLQGRLDGVPAGTVTLVVNGDVVDGTVRAGGDTYTIRSTVGGAVEIRQADSSALPECGGALEAPSPPGVDAAAAAAPVADLPFAVSPASDGSEVDVLVVYTTAAKDAVGGERNIETQIDRWFTEVNGYFTNSGVDLQIRLAHVEELDYEETSSSYELRPLTTRGDGILDRVHALRDAVGADLVHIVERWGVWGTTNYCGIGWLMTDVGPSFEYYGFGATAVGCSGATFAHELGHNMGLRHDRYQETVAGLSSLDNLPYPYAYGYVNQAAFESTAARPTAWRTIMSYRSRCSHAGIANCPYLGRYSNPDQSYQDDPLGVAGTQSSQAVTGPSATATALNNTRTTVAAFRSGGTSPVVASLRRRRPAGERARASSLLWRLAFGRDVKNVTSADFELTGPASPTITVTPKAGSRRIYDIEVTAGVAGFSGDATLGFASNQDILDMTDVALDAAWPVAAQRTFTLDHTAPAPTVAPAKASGSPFAATIRFPEDVEDFNDAGDVSATNATVVAPVRADARTYIVQVTPTVSNAATIVLTARANAAADTVGNRSVSAVQNIGWDPSTTTTLTVGGFSNGTVAENAEWTSATPTVTGSPVGSLTWTREGADAAHFEIDPSTGVLGLPGRDFEKPADTGGDNRYEVTARATDTEGNSATADIAVTVSDAVESRSLRIQSARSRKVPEGIGYYSRPYVCTDPCPIGEGPVGEVTWNVTGADAALFTHSRLGYLFPSPPWAASELSLGAKDFEQPVDEDGDHDYEVALTATDADGNTVSANVTVRVIDGARRPLAITGLVSGNVNENRAWRSGRPSVEGRPIGDLVWSKEGADADRFSIDPASGVLTMAARDYERPVDNGGDNRYDVTARVSDEESNSAVVEVEVTVVDVTDPPPAPTIDSVTGGQRELAVAWTAPAGVTGITFFDLRYIRSSASDKSDGRWTTRSSIWTAGSLEYTLTGVLDGTKYDVQVRGRNSAGGGEWSEPVIGETLPNRSPEAVGTLEERSLRVGEGAVAVDVSAAFQDPDGDSLTFEATSSDLSVARAMVSGSSVRVAPVAAGESTIEVTATDVSGSNTPATQEFQATVAGERGVDVDPVSLQVTEGTTGSYGVVLAAEPSDSVTVTASIQGVTDVSVSPSVLTFATTDWDAPQTVTVEAAEDADAVSDAAVTIRHAVSGGDYGSVRAASVEVTILENDASAVSTLDRSGPESGGAVVFEVTISYAGTSDVLVDYATSNGTALAGSDYTATSGTLTFPQGSTSSQEIRVPVTDDEVDEAEDEAFTLTLSNVRNGLLAGGGPTLRVTGTIRDDDDPYVVVSFGRSSYDAEEGDSVRVEARLDKDPERTIAVPLETTHHGGASFDDYSGVPFEVAFSSDQRTAEFHFSATDDSDEDDGEAVVVRFGSLPSRVAAGGVDETTLAIQDNDGALPPPPPPPPPDEDPEVEASFGSSRYEVLEGRTVQVSVRLSADPEREVSIPLVRRHRGGASEADYSGVPASITFSSGVTTRTFDFAAADDSEEDLGESVALGFGDLPWGVNGGAGTTVSIEDDDTPPMAVIEVSGVECDREPCRALTGEPVQFADMSTGPAAARRWEFGEGTESSLRRLSHSWPQPGFYEVTLWVSDGTRESTSSHVFLVESSSPAGTCESSATRRCLQDSRYAVVVDWWKPDGDSGAGSVVHAGTNDSGLFTFFSRENWEVLIKVLDGCALNGHVWVYGASTTDLGYSIRVTDTATGAVNEYRNEPGRPAPAIADATAFAAVCEP